MTSRATNGHLELLTISGTLRDIETGNTPPSPIEVEQNVISQKEIRTLQDAWTDAKKLFTKNTEIQLKGDVVDIEQVLAKWQRQSEADDSDKANPQKIRILNVYNNIKDGINVLAKLIEPGITTTPISDVYDTLIDLFEEVENFLARFKILNRLDRRHDLSVEMIKSASDMLICFVNICGVAYKALKHSKGTMLKAGFLRNDSGVGNALTEFRQKALHLDQMTHSATLEGVYDVRRTTRELDLTFKNVLKSMELTNTEAGRNVVYAKRHATIKEKIYNKEELAILDKPSETIDLLHDTLGHLDAHDSFRRWRDDNHELKRAAIVLQGSRRSGKSSLMRALKESLDGARENPDKVGSIYVAYHDFAKVNAKSSTSQIPFALRNMAMQVAIQSTAYAAVLEATLNNEKTKHVSGIDSVPNLWTTLKLSTFEKKVQQARMYLLFDGIESESQNAVQELIRVLMRNRIDAANNDNKLSIRIAFTAERSINLSVPVLYTQSITKSLVRQYIIRELKKKDLFQFDNPKNRETRNKIVQAMENATFSHVERKLEHIRDECHHLDNKRLDEILQDKTGRLYSQKGIVSLNELSAKLNDRDIDDLNSLLPWLLHSTYRSCLEIHELEAILYLKNDSESLQGLQEKISGVYRELLYIDSSGYVVIQPDKARIFREATQHTTPQNHAAQASISLNLSIQNAEQAVVRQFIWQLSERMGTDQFDFESHSEPSPKSLFVDRTKSHVDITKLCLELLNEGWHEKTEILVTYALRYLPYHIEHLVANIKTIATADQRTISYGLVKLLSWPYHLSSDRDRDFEAGEPWLTNTSYIDSVRSWLGITRDQLRARERKWVEQALASNEGRLGHMAAFARAVGKKWLRHDKENATDRLYEPEVRISSGLAPWLFRWLNLYIENSIEDADSNTAGSHNQEITGSSPEQGDQVSESGQDEDTESERSANSTDSVDVSITYKQDEPVSLEQNGIPITVGGESINLDQAESATSEQNGMTMPTGSEDIVSITPTKSVGISDDPVSQRENTTSTQSDGIVHMQDMITQIASISPGTEENQSNLTRTESIRAMTVSEKIDRAIEWVKDQEVAYLDKGIAIINIGYTYLYHRDYNKAGMYFNQAIEKPAYARRGLIALGRLHYARGNKEYAMQKFEEGLAIFERQKLRGRCTQDESEATAEQYCELATIYKEADALNLKKMIELYQKSLQCNDNSDIRWKLFGALCTNDDAESSTQGVDAVTQWLRNSGEDGNEVFGRAIRKTAEADSSCVEFENFVHSVQDENLLAMTLEGISAAISEVTKETAQEVQIRGKLLYLKGLVIAKEAQGRRWSDAVSFWEESFMLADLSRWSIFVTRHFSYQSVRLLAQHHLDSHLADLKVVDTVNLTNEDREARFQRLALSLTTGLIRESDDPPYFVKDVVRSSMSAFNVALERNGEARKLSREGMSTAIELLSDDDANNDVQGVESLMRILWSVGDKVGALTAFSLNDRKCEERGHDEIRRLGVVATGYRICDTCLKDLFSPTSGGHWICSSCYDFDLCLACHEKWMHNKLTVFRCNKTLHQLLRVCHAENYAEEEKSGNKVLIDWEWEDCGNGMFKRNGGQLIPLSEWLQILKEKWEITPDVEMSVAQK